MDWNQLQAIVSELSLIDQVRFAELKGIEVPADVKAGVESELQAEKAAEELKANVRFQFGTANQTDRVYLRTKGLVIENGDKVRYSKGLFLETRGIDQALEILSMAKAQCEARGIPTGPTDGGNPSASDAKSGDLGPDGKVIR